MKAVFLRVLEELNDKQSALRTAICNPEADGRLRFELDTQDFSSVPRSPFAYWVSDKLRSLFKHLPLFESEDRTAKQGLATADDFRFVRAWWAVKQDQGDRWVAFAKGGRVSPFYADIYLSVNWEKAGTELSSFAESVIRNPGYFYRPGLTWPLRTQSGLAVRAMPAKCIFGHKGPAIFVEQDDATDLLSLLAITNSKCFRALVDLQMAFGSFEVGVIQRTPVADLQSSRTRLADLAFKAWSIKISFDTAAEHSHAFILPALLQMQGTSAEERAAKWRERLRSCGEELARIESDIDELAFSAYGVTEVDRRSILESFSSLAQSSESLPSDEDDETDPEGESDHLSNDLADLLADLVSWAAGTAFGRFDIRLATGVRPVPEGPQPFDPLPVCSPGMLTGKDGLPIASPPSEYAIGFPEDGILVDDPGDRLDLTTALRSVFCEIFKRQADDWWNHSAMSLGGELTAWLNSNFFEYHLKQHWKSRRKAPIYWQLSVLSSRYSVWLYAHRLTRDTFFHLQTDVVNHKLGHEERRVAELSQKAGPNPAANTRKEIAAQEMFVEELRAFLAEIKRVAPLWNPNLDDGIVLTMAPLWRLVPQHKAWQKELRSKWDELAAGKYDWAHISMHLWPERVVPKCATDRSLAIAHGLEDVFWEKDQDDKWQPRPVPTRPVEDLVRERMSPAVKAALTALLNSADNSAPAPRRAGKGKRVPT